MVSVVLKESLMHVSLCSYPFTYDKMISGLPHNCATIFLYLIGCACLGPKNWL